MNIQEITDLADQLVFNKTGKHLDDLQIQILKETFEGQKYAKIAKICNCSEGYVKTIASELWKILSEKIGETIKKSNFKSAMERFYISNISDSFNIENRSNINICNNGYHPQAETENFYQQITLEKLTEIPQELDAKNHRIQELENILSFNN